jgi:hypothetical protein
LPHGTAKGRMACEMWAVRDFFRRVFVRQKSVESPYFLGFRELVGGIRIERMTYAV